MFGSVHCERKSGDSEWLIRLPFHRIVLAKPTMALLMCFAVCGAARGQAAQTSVEAYADAVKQSVIAQRIVAMEHYLTLPGVSSLKVDALEFLIWDHLRLGHQPQALKHAQELLALEPANPMAVAVLNQEQQSTRGKNAQKR